MEDVSLFTNTGEDRESYLAECIHGHTTVCVICNIGVGRGQNKQKEAVQTPLPTRGKSIIVETAAQDTAHTEEINTAEDCGTGHCAHGRNKHS